MSQTTYDGLITAITVFVGFPTAWTLLWALTKYVNRRC